MTKEKSPRSIKIGFVVFWVLGVAAVLILSVAAWRIDQQGMEPTPSSLAAIEDLAEIDLPADTNLVCSEQQDGMDRFIEAKLSVTGGASVIRELLGGREVLVEQIEDLSNEFKAWPTFDHCPPISNGPFEMYEYKSSTNGVNRFLFTPTSDSDGIVYFLGFSI